MPTTIIPTIITRLIVTTLLLLSGFLFSASAQATSHITATHTSDDFVTVWEMPENDLVLTFPGEGTYNINWGDGGETVEVTGPVDHPYTATGAKKYEVVVSDAITRFNLNNGDDKEKLIDVAQWGDAEWTSMEGAFQGASALTMMSAMDTPDLSGVADMGMSMRTMFAASAFNQDLNSWNVSKVTNMNGTFFAASAFNGNISSWDVSSVTNMDNMFSSALIFDQDIGGWKVQSVTNMNGMFSSAKVFNHDIGDWDVSSVTNMNGMFSNTNIFNKDISRWDVSKVDSMGGMFNLADAFSQNLGLWYIVQKANVDGRSFMLEGQNATLTGHSPTYTLVDGEGSTDNGSFVIVNSILMPDPSATTPITEDTYNVRVQAATTTATDTTPAGTALFGGTTANERTFLVHITDPTDATLSGLTTTPGTLSPDFARDTFMYTITLTDTNPDLTVTPITRMGGTVTVTVNEVVVEAEATSGSAQPIALVIGANTINIEVTATDRSTTQTYTINVIRPLVASAGVDQTVTEDVATVMLAGEAADSSNAVLATIEWTQVDADGNPVPDDVGVTLIGNDNSLTRSFTPPNVYPSKDLFFRLSVTDSDGNTETDDVIITVNGDNDNPNVHAGPDQTANEGDMVTLDARASIDPEGTVVTYLWRQILPANGLAANIPFNKNIAMPTFMVPNLTENTTLVFGLDVRDADGLIHRLTGSNTKPGVNIVVTASNDAPTANAGEDHQGIYPQGATITLDGSASFDPEGENLIYEWTSTAISVVFNAVTIVNPSFIAPTTTVTGNLDYTLNLVVTDATGAASILDTVQVRVGDPNITLASAPTANAGPDQGDIVRDATVTLSGSGGAGADPYLWTQVNGAPMVSLSDPTAQNPTFTAPDINADTTLTFSLVAFNADTVRSAPDTVNIGVLAVDPTDASLGRLELSAGTLSPDFDSDRLAYTAMVPNDISSITLTTLEPNEPTASVTVNGNLVIRGEASDAIDLDVGDNTITVIVTAVDLMARRTYMVTITRLPAVPAITASASTVNAVAGIAIIPVTIDSTGGAVVSYAINPDISGTNNPDISNGLSFDTTTGTLSGTPTAVAGVVMYTITATNTAGSNSATVAITVNGYGTGSTVDAAFSTNADGSTEITLGQSRSGSDFGAIGGTITLPRGLSGATITVLAEVSADLLPADPDGTVPNSRRSLVDIAVTGGNSMAAITSNPATICLPYGTIANPGLYHATGSGAEAMWNQLPSRQVVGTFVCGTTTDFSPFAIFGNAPGNTAPTANADVNQLLVPQGVTIILNGRLSRDTETALSELTFAWTQTMPITTEPHAALLTESDKSTVTFMSPTGLTADLTLVFQLVVTDDDTDDALASDPAFVTITVAANNNDPSDRPIAVAGVVGVVAGGNANVFQGDTVTLDGSGSSDPGTPPGTLTYAWRSSGTNTVALMNLDPTNSMPTFIAPPPGSATSIPLEFSLVVNNGMLNSVDDRVTITVKNRSPVAMAREGGNAAVGATITLQGSGTDAETAPENLRYAWTQTDPDPTMLPGTPPAGTEVMLMNPETANPTFVVPGIAPDTQLEFSLVVFDEAGTSSGAVRVSFTVVAANQPATFGGDVIGAVIEDAATNTATGTITVMDPDADDTNTVQEQANAPTSTGYGTFEISSAGAWIYTLNNAHDAVNGLAAGVTLPDEITVMAADGTVGMITITITGVNDAPTAMASVEDDTVAEGDTVSLLGTGSDPEGDSITSYTWTQISPASPLLIGNPEERQNPIFTASNAGEYTFSLVVNAGTTPSAPNTVAVTISPALAAPDITASTSTVEAVAGTPIDEVTIDSSAGGAVDGDYTINPAIENGLDFDAATGRIFGTPTNAAALLTYTITATNTAGTDTATVDITVLNTYVSSAVDATSATEGGVTKITLGQSANSNIQATGGTITLPSGLSGATITVLALADVDPLLPADQPEEAVENSPRISLVDIAVTGGNRDTIISDSNPVTVCLPYSDSTGENINNPGLYHATGTDATWEQLPSQRVVGTLICGDATAFSSVFSPFAVFGNMPGLDAVAEEQVLNAVLPQLLRATTKIAVDNISNRIDQAFASSPADTANASLNLGGSSSLEQLINNNLRSAALKNEPNLKQMLNNSSFLIPLNVAGDNNYGVNGMTLWGSGDYISLADNDSNVDWKGEVTGASVGIDTRLNKNLVAGAALSYSKGDVDYNRGTTNIKGTLTNTLSSIHPYFGYDLPQGGRVWGALGYGQGEVEISEQSTTSKRDTDLRSLAFGGNRNLSSSDNWLGRPGTTTLRLKGEVSLANIEVDRSTLANAVALSIDAHRYRIALEGSHKQTLANGASISPSVELGIRYDDGSGETGGGLELAGSYRYSNPKGLEMELRAHGLLAHESNYKEWGLSGLVKYQANSGGRGLRLSLQPAWGDTPGNVADRIWQPSAVTDASDEDNSSDRRLQLNTEIGYGLPGLFGRGLLTPYAGLNLANGKQTYNLGGRWAIDSAMNLSLISEHKQTENSILLRGDFKF